LSNFFKLAKLKCKQKIHCFKIQKVKSRWIKEVVARGDGYGKKIGFPTLNLNTGQVDGKIKEGIYASITCYDKQIYPSVLFYGPRLIKGESHNVLEIYVIDFAKKIYGQEVEFKIIDFIREVKNFKNIKELKKEIKKDVEKSLKILNKLRKLV